MTDCVGHAKERQHKRAGSAVTLPDKVAASRPGLKQTLLCDHPVQLPMIPPVQLQTPLQIFYYFHQSSKLKEYFTQKFKCT